MAELREYTQRELLQYNGEDFPRKLVAFRGVVYDVTDCPKWRLSLHEQMHFPGQELTAELEHEAPHGQEVFLHDCVREVGWLKSYSLE